MLIDTTAKAEDGKVTLPSSHSFYLINYDSDGPYPDSRSSRLLPKVNPVLLCLENSVWELARVRELGMMGRKENRSKEHRKHLFSFLFPSLPKQFGPGALVGQRVVGEEVRMQ